MLVVSRPQAAEPTLSSVKPDDEERVLDTLTRAFANDPPSRWLYPEGVEYLGYFPCFASAFGGAAIDRGTALATHDCSGVALWLAPGAGPDEAALATLIEGSIPQNRKSDVFALFDEMARQHVTLTTAMIRRATGFSPRASRHKRGLVA
jgi:hypothetical protein